MHTQMDHYPTRSTARAAYVPERVPALAPRFPGFARWTMAVLLVVGLIIPLAARAHAPGTTARVSVASDGSEGNDASPWFSPLAISADGRFVAFNSAATNLIPGGNLPFGIVVHDRLRGTTELVSVDSGGREGDDFSSSPALSADGRYVAFDSDATNLVQGDRNSTTDVFRHDRLTGETIRVSVSSDGREGTASSHAPALSADGRFIVFHANASLDPRDTNQDTDVYLHDTVTGITELVSVALDGTAGNSISFSQDISADGNVVVFVSRASNLIPHDTTPFEDVYVRDRRAGTTEVVSVGGDGQASTSFFGVPAISADGRFVAFADNTSLVPEDTNQETDVYVRDRHTNATEVISVNSDEVPGDARSVAPTLSADGRYVAFQSESSNFAPEEPAFFRDEDIFVRDRQAGTTVRVSESSAGEQGNARSLALDISGDGRVVAFSSDASNLVPDDTNLVTDVFVHDDRPAADLAVGTTDTPDPVLKGGTLTYRLVVTNHGPAAAAGVEVIDQLPANVRVVSVTSSAGTCAEADGTIVCALGSLETDTSTTITIVVTARRIGTITNTAQVRSMSPDPNPANNTHSEETVVTR